MKKLFAIITAVLLFTFPVMSADLQIDITEDLELEKAESLIPPSISDGDVNLSVKNTPAENGMSIKGIFNAVTKYFFHGIANEIKFLFTVIAVLTVSSLIFTLTEHTHPTLHSSAVFAVSAIIATMLIDHVDNAFTAVSSYVSEITEFMTGLLPFLGGLSVVSGGFTASVVQKAVLLTVIDILQTFMGEIALPVCKTVIAISVAGYVSGIPLGAISEFITNLATKIITVSCGILCAILYFQNTVASVTDSLALRSVKLAAGSFIPIVGSFVSEASGTLISGVKLVKSTFGIFAICVIIYTGLRPIVGFITVKLAVRFSNVVARLLRCDREAKVFAEISAVYNLLSAIMIASACFFIFFIAIFIQSGVS